MTGLARRRGAVSITGIQLSAQRHSNSLQPCLIFLDPIESFVPFPVGTWNPQKSKALVYGRFKKLHGLLKHLVPRTAYIMKLLRNWKYHWPACLYTPELSQTSPLKNDGWEDDHNRFLLGPGLFWGAFAVKIPGCRWNGWAVPWWPTISKSKPSRHTGFP